MHKCHELTCGPTRCCNTTLVCRPNKMVDTHTEVQAHNRAEDAEQEYLATIESMCVAACAPDATDNASAAHPTNRDSDIFIGYSSQILGHDFSRWLSGKAVMTNDAGSR